ncbi:MAG: hypothetical protein IIA44_15305 [Acidobacteria bacterium]|nr:hypothetical protein [Acidobacteriota bacterium]
MRDPRYKTSRWQATRLRVLDRDGWRCMAAHDECRYSHPGSLKRAGRRVAHVHHIVDASEGGDFWDDHNLIAVCAKYNIGERNRRQNRRAARAVSQDPAPEPVSPPRDW